MPSGLSTHQQRGNRRRVPAGRSELQRRPTEAVQRVDSAPTGSGAVVGGRTVSKQRRQPAGVPTVRGRVQLGPAARMVLQRPVRPGPVPLELGQLGQVGISLLEDPQFPTSRTKSRE